VILVVVVGGDRLDFYVFGAIHGLYVISKKKRWDSHVRPKIPQDDLFLSRL
jgi:hypothetical protein